jgi:hypothetical protein
MGSYLEEKLFEILEDGKHKLNFKIPTLSLAGELDGICRITRLAIIIIIKDLPSLIIYKL